VPTSRNVSTTNGLQGGGDLSADRTLSPVYGTTANTIMQGNTTHLPGDVATSTISGTNVTVDMSAGTITATHASTSAAVVVLPNATKTLTGTQTITATDIGQTTPASGVVPVTTASNLNNWVTSAPANAIVATGANVAISATAPTGANQVLITTDTTHATWQTPAAGVTLATTTPAALTYGGAGAVGTGTTAAKSDHVHPLAQITSAQVTGALGYTPVSSGAGTVGALAKYSGANAIVPSFGISATPGTASVAAVSDGSGTLNGWVTHASGDVIQGATGVAGALALFSGAQTIGPSFGISATPGTASVVPVSDVSGTLNGWVTKHVQSITTYTGPPSNWSTSGGSPLTVIGQGVSASSSTGSLSIAAITNVSTTATLNSCAVTLYVNSAQVGVQSVSNAGVAAVPSAGTATFSGGGYTIAVTITSIGAYSCGTQAGLTQIIVTEYSN
jgi:hypothetical protein